MLRWGQELLPLPSLNFPCFPQVPGSVCWRTGSTCSWGPIRQLLLPPASLLPSFPSTHLVLPWPLWGPGVGPQWWSPSRCLLLLAGGGCSSPSTCEPGSRGCSGTPTPPPWGTPRPPLPKPHQLTPPIPHCQQNSRSQGCCHLRNHTGNPFFFFFEPAKRGKETARGQTTRCPGISSSCGGRAARKLTSARLGFLLATRSIFFPGKISFSGKIQLSRWVPLVWGGGGGEGGGVSSTGKTHGQGLGRGRHVNFVPVELAG